MKWVKVLRTLSHVSAALLAVHVVALAIYFSVGMIMGIMDPQLFETWGKIFFISAIVTLAVFCLSTQFYLGLKKQDRS